MSASELDVPIVGAVFSGLYPFADSGDEGRLISALTNMGYRTTEAERAVEALGPRVGREPLPDLLKAALAELSN